MIFLGISLVKTSSLSSKFQEIAKILNDGKDPDVVWAVFSENELNAVFLSADHAYQRLVYAISAFNNGQKAQVQTKLEVEPGFGKEAIELANAPKFQSESPSGGSQ